MVHSTITDEPINHGVETSGSDIVTSVVFGEAPGLQALPVAFIPINVTCNEPPSLVGCDPEICTVFESTRDTIKRPAEFDVIPIPVV